ncbi:MAG TPA: response regulator transcription factor [Bacteroidia bacterium]|nr:response regulator transcription factor [Bacteroidia bacterium]
MNIRVAIVEDTRDIREGLALLIDASDGFQCVDVCADGEEALEKLPQSKPDVVLMDINMPGISGVECVKKLKPQLPQTQFMMCTVYEEDEHIFSSLKAGATGYILKKTAPGKLLEAIRDIHNGGSPMTGGIARKVIASLQPAPVDTDNGLSPREMEILEALAKGLRYKEIADRLFISIDTVRSHIRKIYEKLQVHSRTDALNKVFPKGM